MPTPILATKLYIPPPRLEVVPRPHLIEWLNAGLRRQLTLVSAPAGFGKTTLVSEWIADCKRPVAWLSLDEGDSDLTRFLAYLVAALQTLAQPHVDAAQTGVKGVAANIGAGVLALLNSPQPPPIESILTILLNEIVTIPFDFILVLDDYHVVDAKSVDDALAFLLEHQPPQMHLVIVTREDPHLPLARLRVKEQMIELRVAELRFTPAEAAEFLNQVMGLNLSAEDIAALETRTEGWIAGLQLAAISMRGHPDAASFIQSFTGSHHFVMDYLVEQVLQQQPETVQTFLLQTSILDRMCGPLCDAVLHGTAPSGQETLECLERANLFIVPLDNERRWYRYHHLFADLLRQRLHQSAFDAAELHRRASQWYEDNALALEAFHHAVAANDVERAERLMEGKKMPLHFRGTVNAIVEWLDSLPKSVRDARPLLWVRQATLALMAGQTTGVEEKLQAAEAALQGIEPDDRIRDLIGQIASARAILALTRYDPEAMITQAHRALEYLRPDNLTFQFTANWALATAYRYQGDRAAATQACMESISITQKSGDMFSAALATSSLGEAQEMDNQLHLAAETYQRSLQLAGNYPHPFAGEVHLGLARIYYEWNDLESAEKHGQQSVQLTRLYDRVIDRFIVSEVFLAHLRLAQGDVSGAAATLAQTEQSALQKNFMLRMPEIATEQVLVLLRLGDLSAAAQLAQKYELALCQARVLLAQGKPSAALAILEPLRQQMEAKAWQDERLKVMVLQTLALHAQGEKDKGMQVLGDALVLAEPGGFVRLFVDEGEPMRSMIYDLRFRIKNRTLEEYADRLLTAFPVGQSEERNPKWQIANRKSQILVEPLSPRELEILRLIDQGLSNREIGERLFLALDTVKGHNRRIYDKLQVSSRTEALARARELGLL